MAYAVVDAAELGPGLKRVRAALGVQAFGINQIDLPPGSDRHPEHDEAEYGHEEVYLCLAGSGALRVDGEEVELEPGRYVLVTPEARRKLLSGPDGLSCVVVGARRVGEAAFRF